MHTCMGIYIAYSYIRKLQGIIHTCVSIYNDAKSYINMHVCIFIAIASYNFITVYHFFTFTGVAIFMPLQASQQLLSKVAIWSDSSVGMKKDDDIKLHISYSYTYIHTCMIHIHI